MSIPKGRIHMMQSIIKNKNNVNINNNQKKMEVKSKPKTDFAMKTHLFNNMNLVHKKGVSYLAYKEAKKDKVSSTNYRGKWMGFMYRDPNRPKGGCGVCYQH